MGLLRAVGRISQRRLEINFYPTFLLKFMEEDQKRYQKNLSRRMDSPLKKLSYFHL
jgi:hypothetical protein